MEIDGASNGAAGLRTFEEAKSTLYGTISAAGAALDKASRRRESTVTSVAAYLDRIQLDLSGLSVIHVTGTKGKGSTCAMVESVLRHHGFRTGLYTSPHLLEVTERVRCDGKPLPKEAFARYFFQVWDRLLATATATAEMPTYFHLLTLVGLWCFVREGVDVCVVEVGMGGRFDATNVVPSPVACGVAMLDLDHTQVLGDTLDKIAWEKGGIFKEGCRAMSVEQPRGGMSVLRECAATAGCGELEVVKPLPARDSSGRAYELGLAGEHQRVNAGLALRLCAVWIEAREQQQQQQEEEEQQQQQEEEEKHRAPLLGGAGDTEEEFRGSAESHRGLTECVWPGRCQVFRSPAFPSVTVYLDGAHTEQSIRACLEWFIEKTAIAAETRAGGNSGMSPTPPGPASVVKATVAPRPGAATPRPQRLEQRRSRRVLWFNASHERDVVPLLGALASARRSAPCEGRGTITTTSTTCSSSGGGGSSSGVDENHEDNAPLFDEAWFMEVDPARPSRFAPPTAQEILAPHAMAPAAASVVGQDTGGAAALDGFGSTTATAAQPVWSKDTARGEGLPDAALSARREGDKEGARAETGAGAWQRTLQQVWTSLQTRGGGRPSETLTGTAPEFFEKIALMSATSQNAGVAAGCVEGDPPLSSGISRLSARTAVSGSSERLGREADESGAGGGVGGAGEIPLQVLCTGSLYTVAAALEAFGAQVGE